MLVQTVKPPPPPSSHRKNGSSSAAGNDSTSAQSSNGTIQEGVYALAVVRLADVSHAEMVELNVTEGNSTYAVSLCSYDPAVCCDDFLQAVTLSQLCF